MLLSCKKDDIKPDPDPDPVPVQLLTKVSYSKLDIKFSQDTTYNEYEYCKFYYDNVGKLTGYGINWWKIPCADVFQRINVYYKNDTLIDYLKYERLDTTIICEYFNGVDTLKYKGQYYRPDIISHAFYDSDTNFLYFSSPGAFPTVTYEFDDNGKLKRIHGSNVIELFTYDKKGNLTSYSLYYKGLLENYEKFTYGEKHNPLYQFNPYPIFISIKPVEDYFIVYSPNNLLSYQDNYGQIFRFFYEFDENDYPVKYYYTYDNGTRHTEIAYHFEYETFYINQ